MNECCVSMALGVWSCKRIEDLHEAAGDLYHHDRMGCGRVTEQMTLDPDDWGVAAPVSFPEVIQTPGLMECGTSASLDQACVGSRQRDSKPRTAQERADLPFCPHQAKSREHHAHTGRHARGRLLLRIPGQHPSMPQAAANPSARRINSAALGRPTKVPVAAWR